MKKILSLVLVLMMALGCVTVFAEEAELPELYKSDFTAENFDGWYGNNCQIAVADDGSLICNGRSAGWQSPNRVFPLKAGVEYKISVQVYQDALDTVNFKLSAAQDNGNWISTDLVAVPKGEWTTVEGTLTMGEFKDFILYVETEDEANANKIEFRILDFVVCGPADGFAE